ncbi:MAG: PepSY domain-containing protein [Magnetovibrionaceae bacterium]
MHLAFIDGPKITPPESDTTDEKEAKMVKHGRTITAAIAAAIALPTAVIAADHIADQTSAPLSLEERSKLEDQVAKMGFTIVKIEAEDDEYEIQALRNQQLYEIEIDRATGQIVELERED